MSILKQENKIIMNLSGEILAEPPIIDISSDYGVTKDGGNLVSSVKDKIMPFKFLAQSGDSTIENGDGFEFQSGNKGLYCNGFDYETGFTFELWAKPVDLNSSRQLNQRWLNNDNSNFFECYGFTFTPTFYVGGSQVGFGRNTHSVNPVLGSWNHFLWSFNYQENVLTGFINGKLERVFSDIPELIGNNVPISVGGLYDFGAGYNGSIYNFIVSKAQPRTLVGWTGTSLKWAPTFQVFTPPTFPNTIL